jgi:hypothetical protein
MKLAVLGVGTAGLTSLSHCLGYLNENWTVYSISDPSTPILGIGESTTPAIPGQLFNGTRFSLLKDAKELDSTAKYGVKYVGWRNDDFFSTIIPPHYAMHFNNFKLKEFCFNRFKQLWKDKFVAVESKILSLEDNGNHVSVNLENESLKFDYVIDCRGYPEDYSDYIISKSIPVNHCLVHTVNTPGTWDWTYHVAHRNGWMFGIPLKTRQGWGYLYNDTVTTREDAVADISERFNIKQDDLNLREFAFKTYYAKQVLNNRILKNGNRALFFEPMEALSGAYYGEIMQMFMSYIDKDISESRLNRDMFQLAQDFENFICFVYHGGSTYDSNFWTMAKTNCSNHIQNSVRFQEFKNKIRTAKPHELTSVANWPPFLASTWLDFDEGLQYNYFTKP